MTPDYNPNSLDSRVTELLTLVREQKESFREKCDKDDKAFAAIMAKQDKTNGRVTAIELFIANWKGKTAVVATAIPIAVSILGWFVTKYWLNA